MNEQKPVNTQERDAATLRVLGIFFLVMGTLVLIASYEVLGNTPALLVNLCSGLTLGLVGMGAIWFSKRLARNGTDP